MLFALLLAPPRVEESLLEERAEVVAASAEAEAAEALVEIGTPAGTPPPASRCLM